MAVANELLHILQNEEEPLKKRLKIADNAFKSSELNIRNRQFLLLKWMSSVETENTFDIWNQCKNWLSSEYFKDLNHYGMNSVDYQFITDKIINGLKSTTDPETSETLVQCAILLMENRSFQAFHKNFTETYCNFITDLLKNINDVNLLYKLLRREHIFLSTENFTSYFLDQIIPQFCDLITKFTNDDLIKEQCVKITHKCLFKKDYEGDKNEIESKAPKALLEKLKESDDSVFYQLILHGFCKCNDSEMINKFFVYLLQTIGFKLGENTKRTSLKKSMEILDGLLTVLTKVNVNVTPDDLLQKLLNTVIEITKAPNKHTLNIVSSIITINPLLIEPLIAQLITYIFLSKPHADDILLRQKVTIQIFEVFAKLHRVQNLVSKMIPALKTAFENASKVKSEKRAVAVKAEKAETELIEFNGRKDFDKLTICDSSDEVFDAAVLNYFTVCVTSLASWQVMNLYRTFLYHLDSLLGDEINEVIYDDHKVLYLEILCCLLTQFLSSVRTAEYTVASTVLEKFVKAMDDQKDSMGKFGTALLSMEHNHRLMRSFLNLCNAWGELYMILAHYSFNEEVTLNRQTDTDYSSCNITYLHGYLTSNQWCLIAQRITNFGEKPCKQIMERLCIQKLRAMLIFERQVPEEVMESVCKNTTILLEDLYEDIIGDKFCVSTLLEYMDEAAILKIAEYVLKDVVDLKLIGNVTENKRLTIAVLYTCLTNIGKLFNTKRKLQVNIACTKILKLTYTGDLFNETVSIDDKSDFLKSESANEVNINVDKLQSYLNVLKKLPITELPENTQSLVFIFLSALLIDVKTTPAAKEIEDVLIGIARFGIINLPIKSSDLLTYILQNVDNYSTMFDCMLENSMKTVETLKKLKSCVTYLLHDLENVKSTKCCLAVLTFIHKHKKTKLNNDYKNLMESFKKKISTNLLKKMENDEKFQNVEVFTLLLRNYLIADDAESILRLKTFMKSNIESALTSKLFENGSLLLFSILLQYKPKFPELINADFIMEIWARMKECEVADADEDIFSKLAVAVFEHISNDKFQEIADDLLKVTVAALKSNQIAIYKKHLKTWNAIVICAFNPTKMEIWQDSIETHLMEVFRIYDDLAMKGDESIGNDILLFESNLAQSTHLLLTSGMLDIFLQTIPLTLKGEKDFHTTVGNCINLLESLLKYRKAHIVDRLPPYLQQYRNLVQEICKKADSNRNLEVVELQQVSDCAHKLEKLTIVLIGLHKHMGSVAIYLIADILKEYETITLYPAVKLHMNNCLYKLMSLCDQHGVSCLTQILSTASTEIFKMLYENFKKFYRFTGKV